MIVVDIDVKQLVKDELDSSEELIWEGRPIAKVFTARSGVALAFGLMFTAFSFFWTASLLKENTVSILPMTLIERIFPFFSLPFLAVGIWLMLSPYWMYRETQRTVFVITNKRCIIITAGRTKKVKAYVNSRINSIEKTEYSDGSGDLIFAREQYTTSGDNGTREIRTRGIGFHSIQSVSEVQKLLKAAVRKDVG